MLDVKEEIKVDKWVPFINTSEIKKNFRFNLPMLRINVDGNRGKVNDFILLPSDKRVYIDNSLNIFRQIPSKMILEMFDIIRYRKDLNFIVRVNEVDSIYTFITDNKIILPSNLIIQLAVKIIKFSDDNMYKFFCCDIEKREIALIDFSTERYMQLTEYLEEWLVTGRISRVVVECSTKDSENTTLDSLLYLRDTCIKWESLLEIRDLGQNFIKAEKLFQLNKVQSIMQAKKSNISYIK